VVEVDPSKKVPDLNSEVQDLLLQVVDLEQEVPDLRSGGIPQFNRCLSVQHTGWLKIKYPTGEYAISPQPVV